MQAGKSPSGYTESGRVDAADSPTVKTVGPAGADGALGADGTAGTAGAAATVGSAEERIFEAAKTVFFRQGYDGARMDEIARLAGVNKAMLHYYYRSKRKLFLSVFRSSVEHLLPHVGRLLRDDLPVLEKVDRFIASYLDVALENPHLPGFIFEEMRRNPEWLAQLVTQHTAGLLDLLTKQIKAAAAAGTMRFLPAEQLLTNLLALCAFPFLARPALQALTRLEDDQYQAFLEARRFDVASFVTRALAP